MKVDVCACKTTKENKILTARTESGSQNKTNKTKTNLHKEEHANISPDYTHTGYMAINIQVQWFNHYVLRTCKVNGIEWLERGGGYEFCCKYDHI